MRAIPRIDNSAISSQRLPVDILGTGAARSARAAEPPADTSETAPQAMNRTRMAIPVQMPFAMASRLTCRPSRTCSHNSPMTATPTIVARSSGRTNPVNRRPAKVVTATPTTYCATMIAVRAASSSRSTSAVADARFAARGPNDCLTAAVRPPGMSRPQQSDVDRAHERREKDRPQNKPRGPSPEQRRRQARDEEGGDAELRDGEGGAFPERRVRQQSRRRQHDPDWEAGPDW